MTTRKASVTLHARIFISEEEIEDLIDSGDFDEERPPPTESEAFELLAREKIEKMFISDEPLKLDSIEIHPFIQ